MYQARLLVYRGPHDPQRLLHALIGIERERASWRRTARRLRRGQALLRCPAPGLNAHGSFTRAVRLLADNLPRVPMLLSFCDRSEMELAAGDEKEHPMGVVPGSWLEVPRSPTSFSIPRIAVVPPPAEGSMIGLFFVFRSFFLWPLIG
jgi:hypothetical protein